MVITSATDILAITSAISSHVAICGHNIFHIHIGITSANNKNITAGNNISLSDICGYKIYHKYIGNNISQYKEI